MDRRQKTNPLQWSVFLDFAEEHLEILTKKFDGILGKRKYNELWNEISTILNSMGFLQKTTDKWQKAVSDWRSKVKAKAAIINQGWTQTGGGGPMPSLTDNENRLLAILGWTSVTGISVPELGFPIKAPEPTVQSGSKYSSSSQEHAEPCEEQNIHLESPWRDSSASPPPLIWVEDLDTENIETDKEVSVEKENVEKTANSEAKTTKLKRSRIVTPSTGKSTPSTSKSRLKKKTSNDLQKMQEESINALKEININLGRIADAQEKICSILENFKLS